MKAVFSVLVGIAGVACAQVIDNTATRVQTTLETGMKRLGTLQPKAAHEIGTSRWTLGCETIDREYSDYHAFKAYLPALGIKRIRLQGGWARTEKDPGIYDFAWLDCIIDDARARGLEIWLETSYGNPAYPGGGGRTLAGGMPTSEEGLKAWDRWVEQMALRYKNKVRDWSMWNEPELKGANGTETITAFNMRTA
ncbi:MAG: beta-galactosidase, partial [Kiritimatiellae bacterium]|nr:beta-galactosidase [Kiritimatiellia bacterium]